MKSTLATPIASALLFLAAAEVAHASCGATFCAVNARWGLPPADTASTSIDVRVEYIDQDQPRTGRDKKAVGEVRRHHDEVRTINRNLIVTLDHTIDTHWTISAQLPIVARDHFHIHNHHGAQLPEDWSLDGIGDTRVLVRHNLGDTHWSLLGGVKLPTGEYDERNAVGSLAERTLQSGSGTTDAVAGVRYETRAGTVRRFVAAQAQWPLRERAHYRPGAQYAVDLGLNAALAGPWNGLLQLNAQIKDRDRGIDAESQDTGGSFAWLSPGLSYALTPDRHVYGFVQLPLYQRVNGVQLTADYALMVGVNARF